MAESGSESGPEESPAWEIDPIDVQFHEMLDCGSTSEVFRGTFEGAEVAIKRLYNVNRPVMASKAKKAFQREISVLQSVVHENLVRMHGVVSQAQPFMILMEFCRGGSCYDVIHGDIKHEFEMSWHQAIKIALDVGSAMCYLHAFNPQIIHRDLKSSNILLVEPIRNRADCPWAKVVDFGLARVIANEKSQEKMTMDVGTFHWMAPEVLLENSYDEKVDVYSFAMILYEVICCNVPFGDLEASDAACAAVNGQRPSLEDVPRSCPEKLRMLMTTCWNQEPGRRPSFANVVKWLGLVAAELGFNPEQPGRVVQL